ncbi:hypothetical protein LCGC14_1143450 [marine sediment metagenome]|uniref:Uncharacterized protein n=1 Tax=marine sediment metagenome TaxID=412755 RepID=A0A0F9Q3B4_9ZZZZ
MTNLLIVLGCIIIICVLVYRTYKIKLQGEQEMREWLNARLRKQIEQDIEDAIIFGTQQLD